jgi:hypothetical protein
MDKPLIAIVGSVDATRSDYDPPLKNAVLAKQAAEELGCELARAGYALIVYTSDPAFIEADVVRGYINSSSATPKSIQIRFPQVRGDELAPLFDEQQKQGQFFEPVADTHPSWQVCFYQSLKDAQGILLLGGASSSFITGLVARMYRIPLIAIATFGGSAQTVWSLAAEEALWSEEERNLMGAPTWNRDAASKLVEALGNQRKRLMEEDQKRLRSKQLLRRSMHARAGMAGSLLLIAAALTMLGFFWQSFEQPWFGLFFMGIPLLAGASGGLFRTLLDFYRGMAFQPAHSTPVASVLGMGAGLITAILFVVAQWATNPEIKDLAQGIPPGLRALVFFELVIGFIAGLTLESVFGKLQRTDVVEVDAVAVTEP